MLYEPRETGRRLLDALARRVGEPASIQALAADLERRFAKGYYANTYRELVRLRDAGLVRWSRVGRTSQVALDPAAPTLLDHLVELEAWRRRHLLADRPDAWLRLQGLAAVLSEQSGVDSAWLLDARRGIRLNRWELLVVSLESPGSSPQGVKLRQAAARHDVALDVLQIPWDRLGALLASGQETPMRDWLQEAAYVVGADRHWGRILAGLRAGLPIRLPPRPVAYDESTVVSNLAVYGYEEFGTAPAPSRSVALEALVCRLLQSESSRRVAAIPLLLERNPIDPGLLAFMARKQGLDDRLRQVLSRRRPRTVRLRTALEALRRPEGG